MTRKTACKRRTIACLATAPVVVILLIVLLLNGCSNAPIKIGLMADLSGRAAELGIEARNGAVLAVEEINAAGGIRGRNIELIVKDDAGLPDTAIQVDAELVTEKIVMGIGHMTSGPGIAGMKVLQGASIPILSPLMSADQLGGRDDGFYRIIDSNARQGELLAADALKQLALAEDAPTAAILIEETNLAFTKGVADSFERVWTQAGGTINWSASYTSNQSIDFDGLVAGMAESGADTVLIAAGGLDLGIFVQELHAVKPDVHVYSSMWGMTEDFVRNAGQAGDGTRFPGIHDPHGDSEAWLRFSAAYRERWREEPAFSSVYAYEAVQVTASALRRADGFTADAIEAALISGAPYEGLQTLIPMDAHGDSARGFLMFELRDGKFILAAEDGGT